MPPSVQQFLPNPGMFQPGMTPVPNHEEYVGEGKDEKLNITPPGPMHSIDDMASYFQKMGMKAHDAVAFAQRMAHDRILDAGIRAAFTAPISSLINAGKNPLAVAATQYKPQKQPINWGSLSSIFPPKGGTGDDSRVSDDDVAKWIQLAPPRTAQATLTPIP